MYVIDLGQNFAGFARLKVRGKPGQKITLRFAERLNPDGTLYTVNLRAARRPSTTTSAKAAAWKPGRRGSRSTDSNTSKSPA